MYRTVSELGAREDVPRDQYSVLEIGSSQDKDKIVAQNKVVCVNIYADWCGPCKQTAGAFSVIANTHSKPGVCAVIKQKFETISQEERKVVGGVPMYFFYLNGREIPELRVVGADLDKVEGNLLLLIEKASVPSLEDYTRDSTQMQGPQYSQSSIRNQKPRNQYNSSSDQPPNPYSSESFYHQPYKH